MNRFTKREGLCTKVQIPPTAVGGWFKSDLFMAVTPALKLKKVAVREGLKIG